MGSINDPCTDKTLKLLKNARTHIGKPNKISFIDVETNFKSSFDIGFFIMFCIDLPSKCGNM